MRLCFVGSTGSMHVERWIRYFAREHAVHLLTPSPVPAQPLPGVTLHRFMAARTGLGILDLPLNGLAVLPNVVRFRGVLGRIRPDLVHVHYLNEAALLALLAGARPLVLTAWGSDVLLSAQESRVRRAALRVVLRGADLITCDAAHMREALLRLGAPAEKTVIVYFGTDVQRFHPARRSSALRARLGLDGTVAVISTRRLEPLYDVESLIRAAPLILAAAPHVRFLIAGTGSDEPRLRALAAALGVDAAVTFLGWMSEEDLAVLLSSSDIYASTALSDGGLAASTAEAMASGLPVIVTDVGDNRDWVIDGVGGFLVPPRRPDVLASRILYLVAQAEERGAFGARGREVVWTRNNWEVEMERMAEMYRDLTRRPAGGRGGGDVRGPAAGN